MDAEPRHGTRGGSAGDAFMKEEGQDRLVERSKMVLGIFIDENRDFFGCAFLEHNDSFPSR